MHLCILVHLCIVVATSLGYIKLVFWYYKEIWYFLVRDATGSKLPPVLKIRAAQTLKRSRGVQIAYRIHPFSVH